MASPRAGPSSQRSQELSLRELQTYSSVTSTRLKSLYSDISLQKISNPAAYTSNLDWWRRTLEVFVSKGFQQPEMNDVLIIDVRPDIAEKLRFEGVGKPLGLATVISELIVQRSLIPFGAFQNSQDSIYASPSLTSRATKALTTPLWWVLESLSLVDNTHVAPEPTIWTQIRGRYVVVALLERAASVVVDKLRDRATSSPADSLYDFYAFKKLFGGIGDVFEGVALSERDLRVLIKFLSRDQGVIVSSRDLIKLKADAASADEISAIDRGIFELKTGVEKMERQIDSLDSQIVERTKKARECIRAKTKDTATTHIKARKFLEETRAKRLGSLEILQSMLLQVEAAAQDIEIISQFESSTATLKTILSHPSLQRATIDATMDAMADANVEARSIDDAIRNGIEMSQADGVAEIDDEEIQKELENLVDEAQREERAQKDVSVYETDNAQRQGQPEVERSEEEARKLESPALEDVDTNGGLLTESNRNIDQMPDAPTRPLESSVEAESKRLSSKVQIESI